MRGTYRMKQRHFNMKITMKKGLFVFGLATVTMMTYPGVVMGDEVRNGSLLLLLHENLPCIVHVQPKCSRPSVPSLQRPCAHHRCLSACFV